MSTPRLTPNAALRALLLAMVVLVAAPAAAPAARLAGGGRQAALRRAFDTTRAHRARLIVSIRTSTVAPAWAVVRSVPAESAGRTGRGAASLHLSSAYYHRVGGRERPGSPPAAARADLRRVFRVAVVYRGSGSETIDDNPGYRSDCAGAGEFVDQETVGVTPMSWTVRYVVDLDDVLAAARSAQGTAITPAVTFDAAGSRLHAVERLTRTVQDVGCNGHASTSACTKTFHAGGPDPGAQLSLGVGGGLAVGVPARAVTAGTCHPDVYTLGPALWDSGGVTADAAHLGLFGGSLPANPYAPVRVAWPGASALGSQTFATSPCQGDLTCADAFAWRGTVRLEAVS